MAFFVATPGAAAKAETFNYKFKGLMADAYFSITDESSCIDTVSYLTAFAGKTSFDKQYKTEPSIYVVVYQYDQCKGEFLLDAWTSTSLSRDDFTIKNQLNSAELNKTVIVEDLISGSTFPVEIHLTWVATDEGFFSEEHTHVHEPNLKVNYRYTAFVRSAIASGSITGLGIDFAQLTSVSAQLSNVKAGFVEVTLTP
jgi:hypothetical protein